MKCLDKLRLRVRDLFSPNALIMTIWAFLQAHGAIISFAEAARILRLYIGTSIMSIRKKLTT